MNILTIGYTAEGSTDVRFLGNIIKRTFEEIAFECEGEIEIFEPQFFPGEGNSFVEETLDVSKKAANSGIMVLCVHTDSDDRDDQRVRGTKILPAWAAIEVCSDNNCCKNLVAVVPVRMTEAWMLADMNLLMEEIGGGQALSISNPEGIADPKDLIKTVIREAFEELSRRQRRRRVEIDELYQPIGKRVDLGLLRSLPSYQRFFNEAREALRRLNYLR